MKSLHALMPLVHGNLHQLASKYMRAENAGHTLQATALVNEAFIKLCGGQSSWQNRAHFIAIAARAMRQILVDHAKARHRDKRGGHNLQVTLHEAHIVDINADPDMLDLEAALSKLAQLDARKAQIIEMNIFGGMTYDEMAEVLTISVATVDRELRFSKAWLQRELGGSDS